MVTPIFSQIWHISISRVYEEGVSIIFCVQKTGTTYIYHDPGSRDEVINWYWKDSLLL